MRQYFLPLIKTILLTLFLTGGHLFAGSQKTVLFDESHGQRFLVGQNGALDLSNLSDIFKNQGWAVKVNKNQITEKSLSGVEALVISGAFKPVNYHEVEAITKFIAKGGRLCVMLHIGPPLKKLLHTLNVSTSNGVVRERINVINKKDLDFHVKDLKPHPLTKELKYLDVFGGWALMNTKSNAQIIAQTSNKSWVDLNGNKTYDSADAVQAFGLVVTGKWGEGHFAVFGDDAIFQNQFLVHENRKLGQNLAKWLGSSTSTQKEFY